MAVKKKTIKKLIKKHAKGYKVNPLKGGDFSYERNNGWYVTIILSGAVCAFSIISLIMLFLGFSAVYTNFKIMLTALPLVISISLLTVAIKNYRIVLAVRDEFEDEIRKVAEGIAFDEEKAGLSEMSNCKKRSREILDLD